MNLSLLLVEIFEVRTDRRDGSARIAGS